MLAGLFTAGIASHGPAGVTCDAVTNAEVYELDERIHDRLIGAGHVDPTVVRIYRPTDADTRLGAGTVLPVTRPADGSRGG